MGFNDQPLELLSKSLGPREAAERFGWMAWPAPCRVILFEEKPGNIRFKFQGRQCWYRLARHTHPASGEEVWAVWWTETS